MRKFRGNWNKTMWHLTFRTLPFWHVVPLDWVLHITGAIGNHGRLQNRRRRDKCGKKVIPLMAFASFSFCWIICRHARISLHFQLATTFPFGLYMPLLFSLSFFVSSCGVSLSSYWDSLISLRVSGIIGCVQFAILKRTHDIPFCHDAWKAILFYWISGM